MVPIIEVSDEVLSGLDKLKIPYSRKTQINLDNDNYVFVPSLKLYVAKERILKRKNWFDAHNELQAENLRMLTIPEFIEFLKYAKSNPDLQNLYDEITQVRNPWRAEWLDADFKVKDKELYINSRHLVDAHGNLIPQYSEPLDENTLMEDRVPGISLDSWLEKPTSQGLPSKKTKSGDLYYLYPKSDNNSVARFVAGSDLSGLGCWVPSNWGGNLGVRAVKRA